MACSQLWGTPLPLMYMSARRTGATELPREVAFQSQAAAAAGSLACMALANSSWPGSGLDLGFATDGGGSLAGSLLASVATGDGFGWTSATGFCGVVPGGGADGVAAGFLSGVGVVCAVVDVAFGCC